MRAAEAYFPGYFNLLPMANNHLFRLLQLTDPVLPVGGFAHSYGLETYVQKGIVCDAASAHRFIRQMLSQNIQYTDAAFVSIAFDAINKNEWNTILELDGECHAVKLAKEIRQASQKMGIRLLKIFETLFPLSKITQYLEAIRTEKMNGHYSVAFGITAAVMQVTKQDALTGFYYNAAAGLVTNSVKLVPLGQQQGQEILFALQPLMQELVQSSLQPDPELVGLCCPGFDIRSMQHEQLYSRLYMS